MKVKMGIFQFMYNIKKAEVERIEQRLRIKVETSITRARAHFLLSASSILTVSQIKLHFWPRKTVFSASDEWVE